MMEAENAQEALFFKYSSSLPHLLPTWIYWQDPQSPPKPPHPEGRRSPMKKRMLCLVLFAALIQGCAIHDWMVNQPAEQSTTGNDPNKAEKGKMKAPPAMGVDVGDRTSQVSVVARVV
jgi:hypothetical protein